MDAVAYFDQFHQYISNQEENVESVLNMNRRFSFILRDQFQTSMKALLTGRHPETNPAVPLINAVLVLGCRLVQKRRTTTPV